MVPFKLIGRYINKIKMKFVVSHLQVGRLGFQYDESRPDKITVVSDKARHLYGHVGESKLLSRSSAFIFKGEEIHPNQLMLGCLQLEKSFPPKFCYLNPGVDPRRPVMIDVANEGRHNETGLGHFAKFRLSDLLQHFTDATLRQRPTNISPGTKILEIVGRNQRIEVDLILEPKEKAE